MDRCVTRVDRAHEAEYVDYVTAKVSWLRRTAFLLCQDWYAADDITQVAITRLYVNWSRARAAGNLDAYVRTILVRVFLAERRSRWSRITLGLFDHDQPDEPAHPAEGTEVDVRAAIAALSAGQRATVVLRFLCDLSVEQTAATLGVTTGAVKSQTARALEALRRSLGDFAPHLSPTGAASSTRPGSPTPPGSRPRPGSPARSGSPTRPGSPECAEGGTARV